MNFNNGTEYNCTLNPDTWFEVHRLFWPRRTDGAWRSISILAIVLAIYGWFDSQDVRFLTTFLPLAIGSFLIPGFTRSGRDILVSYESNIVKFVVGVSQTNIKEWYRFRFEEYVASSTTYGMAIVFSLLASCAMGFGGAFANFDGIRLTISVLIMVFSTFVCGIGIMSVFYLARMVWLLGRGFAVKVGLHDTTIMMTGSTLLRLYILVTVIWMIYSSSALFFLPAASIPLLLLAVPAVTFIVGSFIVAQIPLHERMRDYKNQRLGYFQEQLDVLLTQNINSLDDQSLRKLELHMALISETSKLPTWPFGFASFSGIVLAALSAVSPLLINIASQVIVSYFV